MRPEIAQRMHAEHEQHDGEPAEHAEQARVLRPHVEIGREAHHPRVLAHVLGEGADVAGERVAEQVHEEPDAHHQRGEPQRRELGDHREADRADAQLAGGVEEVGEHQPDHAGLHVAGPLHLEHGDHEADEAERDLREAEVHLDRRRGIPALRAEPGPEHGERDAEQHDEQRVQRLEPAGRHQEGSDLAIGVLVGEQVHEAAGLLEGRPEDHDEGEDHEDHAQAVALDLGERLLRRRPTS